MFSFYKEVSRNSLESANATFGVLESRWGGRGGDSYMIWKMIPAAPLKG